MDPTNYDNDELIFVDEDDYQQGEEQRSSGVWNVLVVDDDEEIHSVTRLALSDLMLNGKKLNFLHAHSGAEALDIIEQYGKKLAIILLDVVMETDDAGLQVARLMREKFKLQEPRIILRTGQPGYAPEESVIKEYDINDYKTKTELTRSKLVTTVIASLRSYQQILTINQSRIGLEKIIVSASNLLEEHSVKGFCEGVVTQISSLLGLEAGGVVCARAGSVLDKDEDGVYVLGAAGEFAEYINKKLESLHDEKIVKYVNICLHNKSHVFEPEFSVLYMSSSDYEAAVFLNVGEHISLLHKQLIEIFLSSISVGYENVNLFHELRNAAFQDWLTRLPNRNEFINMLDNLPVSGSTVIALVDIDHFSDVNDGLGQEVGNELLIAVAERLNATFSEHARLGRVAADVFGIIGDSALLTVERIQDVFKQPFIASEHSLLLNVCIGLCDLSLYRDTGINILKYTNIALNRAKKSLDNSFQFYAPELEQRTTNRLEMVRQLRIDFSENKLQLWYQPQVDLSSKKVVGMEALLRWPDKNGGYISPAVFVPLAEYSGLIVDIGIWVLNEACRQLQQLNQKFGNGLRMAVNISMPQFRDNRFVDMVKKAVLDHELAPESLELEITESVVMDEPQIVVDSLSELKSFGVTIAIDDFGTGFSSMSYLQKLPLDRLKVDRTFVNEIAPGKSAFIAETIVTLGAKLGLQTVAEGVEEDGQARYMLDLGCNEAQGYFYAKPMPFDELTEFLTQNLAN